MYCHIHQGRRAGWAESTGSNLWMNRFGGCHNAWLLHDADWTSAKGLISLKLVKKKPCCKSILLGASRIWHFVWECLGIEMFFSLWSTHAIFCENLDRKICEHHGVNRLIPCQRTLHCTLCTPHPNTVTASLTALSLFVLETEAINNDDNQAQNPKKAFF